MKKNNNNKGFSLVELIVVIAIMVVLVAAIAPQLIGYVGKAREAKDITVIGDVTSAMQAYLADDESATPTMTISFVKGEAPTGTSATNLTNIKYPSAKTTNVSVTITVTSGQVTYSGLTSEHYQLNSDNSAFIKK